MARSVAILVASLLLCGGCSYLRMGLDAKTGVPVMMCKSPGKSTSTCDKKTAPNGVVTERCVTVVDPCNVEVAYVNVWWMPGFGGRLTIKTHPSGVVQELSTVSEAQGAPNIIDPIVETLVPAAAAGAAARGAAR